MKSRSGPYLLLGLTGIPGAGRRACVEILTSAHAFGVLSLQALVDAEVAAAFSVDRRIFSDRTLRHVKTTELSLRRCTDLRFVDLILASRKSAAYDEPMTPARAALLWELHYRLVLDGVGYWISQAHEQVERMQREGWRRIVVPDVSLPEDAVFIRQMGGQIWRVRNPRVDACAAAFGEPLFLKTIRVDRDVTNEGSALSFVYDVLQAYHQTIQLQYQPANNC